MMARLYSYDEETVSFYNIDCHAEKVSLPKSHSLVQVVKYLSSGLPPQTIHRQLKLARACIVWLQVAFKEILTSPSPNVPSEVKLLIECRQFPEAYQLICEKAGIECELVRGLTKGGSYKTGATDPFTLREQSWNAIRCDGTWHLVNTRLCISGVLGYEEGGGIVLEADGEAKLQSAQHCSGSVISHFNSLWFCTNPAIFVTQCFPDDSTWQLLNDEPKSLEQYLDFPHFSDGFFKAKLTLLSKESCRLESQNGKATIAFLTDKGKRNSLNFHNALTLLDGDASKLKRADIPLLVRPKEHMDGTREYEIHFPVVGTYKFQVDVLLLDQFEMYDGVAFIIKCSEINPDGLLSPVDTGIEGWGYGQSALEAGLEKPSRTEPTVIVNGSDDADDQAPETFKFRLDEDLMNVTDYQSEMYAHQKVVPGLTETRLDPRRCQLEIRARVGQEGEYALVVKARQKGSGARARPVLNYLVTTQDDQQDRDVKKQIQDRKRQVIQETKRSEREKTKQNLQDSTYTLLEDIERLKALLPPDLQDKYDVTIDLDITDQE